MSRRAVRKRRHRGTPLHLDAFGRVVLFGGIVCDPKRMQSDLFDGSFSAAEVHGEVRRAQLRDLSFLDDPLGPTTPEQREAMRHWVHAEMSRPNATRIVIRDDDPKNVYRWHL